MSKARFFYRMLFLMATAESHYLTGNAECTTEDGESGICMETDQCAIAGNASTRRRSRRFSCGNKNTVCCPFDGGRRRSSVQKIVYERDASHNRRCEAMAGSAPPDPKSGCCGRDLEVVSRILGGTDADPRQYPWMALVEYRDESGRITPHMCSGFLISARYALTAKHCVTAVKRDGAHPAAMILSEYDRATETDCVETEGSEECITAKKIDIEEMTLHPTRDLALIRLKQPAPYNDYIRPICLPESDISQTAGEERLEFTVAGWGLRTTTPPRTSSVKRQTIVPFVPAADCNNYYRHSKRMKAEERQICAGGLRGVDSCNGDSGGPLMYDNGEHFEASGVISFGPRRCGTAGQPAVHVNVHAAKRWILDGIRD